MLLLAHYTFQVLVLVLYPEITFDFLFDFALILGVEGIMAELACLLPPLLVILHFLLHLIHLLSEVLADLHFAVVICRLLLLSLRLQVVILNFLLFLL